MNKIVTTVRKGKTTNSYPNLNKLPQAKEGKIKKEKHTVVLGHFTPNA